MSKVKLLLVTISLLMVSAAVARAESFPLAGAAPKVETTVNGGAFTIVDGTSGSSTGTGASASINLATGELKILTQGTNNPSATVIGFDFFNFSGNGNVSYNFAVNGSANNLNPIGAVETSAQVIIYDVTGLSPNLYGGNASFQFINSTPISASSSSQETVVYGSGFSPTGVFGDPVPSNITFVLSQDGSAVPISMNLSGTLAAQAGHTYGVALVLATGELFLSGGFQQGADLSHTAVFSFTDLGGLAFQSSTGEFLSKPIPSPEPNTLTLLGLSLAGMVGMLALRRKGFAS